LADLTLQGLIPPEVYNVCLRSLCCPSWRRVLFRAPLQTALAGYYPTCYFQCTSLQWDLCQHLAHDWMLSCLSQLSSPDSMAFLGS
ncbi:hypothetical protein NDU88_001152, partial [Pleurodeles waltl]